MPRTARIALCRSVFRLVTGVARSANPYHRFHVVDAAGAHSTSVCDADVPSLERAPSQPLRRQSSSESSTKGFIRSSIDKVCHRLTHRSDCMSNILLLMIQRQRLHNWFIGDPIEDHGLSCGARPHLAIVRAKALPIIAAVCSAAQRLTMFASAAMASAFACLVAADAGREGS